MLEAQIALNPNFIWQSMHMTIPIIAEGSRMRIRNSSTISTWGVPWLPNLDKPRISSPAPSGIEDLKVSDLFNNVGREWN